jgi:hypothetical protein
MSSILENSNVESGDPNPRELVPIAAQRLEEIDLTDHGEYDEGRIEYAAKVVEAEYIHEHHPDEVGGKGLLSKVGTEGFERILDGAKEELNQELYNLGKAYLLKNGSDKINDNGFEFAENTGMDHKVDYAEPEKWFNQELYH